MNTLKKLVGRRIRSIRKKRGFTQEKLADKAQLTQQYVGSVERGTLNITLNSLERIITALEVDFDELLTLKGITKSLISEDEQDKLFILTVHNQLLKSRSVQEIKAIHRITEEIIKIIKANK